MPAEPVETTVDYFTRHHILSATSDLVLICCDHVKLYTHWGYLRQYLEPLHLELFANVCESPSYAGGIPKHEVRVDEDSKAWSFVLALLYPCYKPKPKLTLVRALQLLL